MEPHQCWSCTFISRAGARAQAIFPSAEEAQQFAERHAQVNGEPARWDEAGDAWVLTTSAGEYLVTDC